MALEITPFFEVNVSHRDPSAWWRTHTMEYPNMNNMFLQTFIMVRTNFGSFNHAVIQSELWNLHLGQRLEL